MAYWWVSQNRTYKQERKDGYLWAPKSTDDGTVFRHWSNMTLVRPGDIIFSYANQSIGAVGIASSVAYDSLQPAEFNGQWQQDGRRVDVTYQPVEPALRIGTFVDSLIEVLPSKHSPLTKLKTGVQGYLFAIPPKAGELICDKLTIAAPVDQLVADALQRTIPDETTRQALVKARVGQGRWRQDLLQFWSGKCAVTGLAIESLLRASHVKPWRASDNSERLDVYNGLLLGPAYDAAFDAGLITFSDDRKIIVSDRLPVDQRSAAGIEATVMLSKLRDEHRPYLEHHRANIYKA